MAQTQQISMTYGVLPTREQFSEAFDRECPRGQYNIRLGASDSRTVDGFKLGDGDWTESQLWDAIQEIVNASQVAPDEETQSEYYARIDLAMDLVSSIMSTLGFEWI